MAQSPTHISETIPVEFNPVKLRETLDRPFPPESIKTRKGNFGAELSYVEAPLFIKRLNEAFGVNWSFQIVQHEIHDDECIVLGKLTTYGHVRMAFGGSQITRNKETGATVSIADDLKSAATDAFKKSCSFLGVGLHLYGDTATDNTNGKPAATNGGNGNGAAPGNGHAQTNGGNGDGNRLSSKQLGMILALARERNINRDKLTQMVEERYNRRLEFLTRSEASFFIGELQAA